jgi:hypothetical protein
MGVNAALKTRFNMNGSAIIHDTPPVTARYNTVPNDIAMMA